MKKILCIAAVALMLTAAASAQTGPQLSLFGGTGLTVPVGDMSDLTKTGYHGMFGAGVNLVPTLETVARFGFHTLPIKDETNTDGDFTVSEYGLDVRANLSAPTQGARPYALIGAGWAKIDYPSGLVDSLPAEQKAIFDGLEPETKFFYSFGGGIKVRATVKIDFFLEARYTKISVKDGNLNYFPVTIGLNLNF